MDITVVVTVTDDGGSSGRLRREFEMLPPGDIRNCMVALSEDEGLMSRLFQYRFAAGRGLKGHSFGNLFLTAMTHLTGDFAHAVRLSSEVLASRGTDLSFHRRQRGAGGASGGRQRGRRRDQYQQEPVAHRLAFAAPAALPPAPGNPRGHRPGGPDHHRTRFPVHQHHSESAGGGHSASHRLLARAQGVFRQPDVAAGRDHALHGRRSRRGDLPARVAGDCWIAWW